MMQMLQKMIDLRSDTVTRPTPAMLEFMMNAEVGDDVFGDDPTVIALEAKVARIFGKEAALFCPSGTMANQVAIKALTQPGDEIICDIGSHVYNYEGGGIAFNSGCSVRLVHGDRGRMNADQVAANINPDNIHYPVTRLVVAENTCNRGGGSFYSIDTLRNISEVCKNHFLKFHLDGARLFNALVETGEKPFEYGRIFDSISICLSKGLGAPVGSVLTGSDELITRARRIRKVFGGGMRQAGYLAAAGIYALDNHVERLKEDHRRARNIGQCLSGLHYVKSVMPVDTNIIIFLLEDHFEEAGVMARLKEKSVLTVGFGPQTIRMVTHLGIDDQMVERTKEVLAGLG
jgi:threonine aldolase